MLSHISIKNYALIRQLELGLSADLNVITGETGAGKSILLGAIGLLLGNRADSKTLWDENQKCVIEGTFDLAKINLKPFFEEEDLDYQQQAILRREVSANGKSRAFINDTPVTLDVMRKIGSRLMDIHSQHETLDLGTHQFQLDLIDAYAVNDKIREKYHGTWKQFTQASKKYHSLLTESTSLKAESDFVKFQLDELVKANLADEKEQEKLEAELKKSEHAEEIKTRLQTVLQILGESEFSVTSSLTTARSELQSLANLSESFTSLLQRIESARIELNDMVQEVENEDAKMEIDPARTLQINDRLSLIYQLQQKHRVKSISALIEIQKDLQTKADKTDNLDEDLAQALKELNEAKANLNKDAEELSKSRKKIAAPLAAQLIHLLKDLGIPDAQINIEQEKSEPSATGADKVEIHFSANKGMAPKPLAQVASGGEFSRLMFAVKYVMAEKRTLPTLILDEIDNGVSGEVAIKLGVLMNQMAQNHQLIAISHLPQIAAKAGTHYLVFKDNSQSKTESQIKELTKQERITEIAKMIGGSSPSATALKNAKELMEA
jgi:DNA repair protein RecN (Recombination protein N)